jgi:hypothetical protein
VTAPSESAGQSTSLSRELRDFLIRFSIALHRFGMYPEGHPSLAPTVEQVVGLLEELLFAKPTLSLGVARTQLVIEGVATDPKHPVLLELATRLHRHHLGALSFERGIVPDELHEFLLLVAHDPDRGDGPLGLNPEFRKRRWPHLSAYPLDYERLQFMDGQERLDETEQARATRTRSAQLWLGLARAALAAGTAEDALTEEREEELINTSPEMVARAIDSRGRDSAYDQVIVGYMLQIADELKSGQTQESSALRKRVSDLVSSLDRGTLGRLLAMGGDASQRRRFLLSASEGMTVGAVVDLVEAAGNAGDETVSHSLLRVLQKLAQHAERGGGRRGAIADESIRDQIRALVRGWSLRDPNPGAYGKALQRMSLAAPVFVASSDAQFAPEPRRLLAMGLELDTVGEPVQRALDTLVDRGELPWVLETLRLAYAPSAADVLRRRVARPAQIALVFATEPVDFALLDELITAVGVEAADPLLDALADADAASTRRAIIDRLTALGPGIEPAVLRRLGDPRWYVVRNLLGLIAELPRLPARFDPWVFLKHADSRVRREAMRLLLRDPATRDRALVAGLRDNDDHLVRLALTVAAERCPEGAVPLIVTRALSGANTDQRVTAIRVLGGTPDAAARSALLQLTAPRKAMFGEKPPAKTAEYLAALTALHGHAADAKVAAVLAQAQRSRDPEVARAARGGRMEGE